MRINPVGPEQLHAVWPKVASGLWKILDLCPDRWIPEDIYFAVRAGKASLFVFEQGFYVAEVISDPNDGTKFLNVWALYTEPDQAENVKHAIIQSLDTLAAHAGCQALRFVSPRSGWGRYLDGHFEEKARIYERTVR